MNLIEAIGQIQQSAVELVPLIETDEAARRLAAIVDAQLGLVLGVVNMVDALGRYIIEHTDTE